MIKITRDGGKTIEEADEALFEKREGFVDNENERTSWVEYWEGNLLVHRSAHVMLKKPPLIFGKHGVFNG